MCYLGNGSAARKDISDEDREFLDFLDAIFPPPRTAVNKQLMIFDGTANQKMAILVWMGDQVINSIRDAFLKTSDTSKKLALHLLHQEFEKVFARVKINVGDITESTSCYPEEYRKDTIEKYARVIDMYAKEVERIDIEPPPEPTLTRTIDQGDDVQLLNRNHVSTQLVHHTNGLQQFNTNHVSEEQGFTLPHQASFEIPKAAVPMTRILGIPNSLYVSPKAKGITIHEFAYADQHRDTNKVPYRIDLNETYKEVLHGVPKNLTYVGAKYPDGTSLSYLPIKEITLLREQSFVQHPTKAEGGVVELKLAKVIYDIVKRLSSEAYLERYPDHVIRYPHEYTVSDGIIKIHALARGYRRMRVVNGTRTFHVTLLRALKECTHDMTGDGLLHLRFDKPSSEDKRATMKLIFFGLQMVRDPSNHFQKIFRM